jgi:DNA-binding NarL/FixJ family response regulator
LPLPFEQALTELAFGQMLRRRGHRRAAITQLDTARERFSSLGAHPYLERCNIELKASGLAPAKRTDRDPARLTPQERAVATHAAAGLSNRDIAAELAISEKTVQFHVSNVYSKLGVRSRLQLANRWSDQAQSGKVTTDEG